MLLILPLKATKRIDLLGTLSKWVDNSHPHYKADQISLDIKRLHSIRSDLSSSLASSSSHLYALKNNALLDLIEYHACLVECINRGFPSDSRDADVNGTMDANLHFAWKNAFEEYDGRNEEEGQCSQRGTTHFTFERACVLWNIAALYTFEAGTMEDWGSKEGRMTIKQKYALAASILRHIRDLTKSEKEADLMPDLYQDSLEMCQRMCLMQGQMAAYEALKVKLSEPSATTSTYTLLAKISSQVANHADKALEASQGLSVKDKPSSKVWGSHFKVLSMLFRARAEFLQSQVERMEYRYGYEIARLERTVKMAREGIDFSKTEGFVKVVDGPSLLGKVPENLQSLLVNAKERRKKRVEENNSIYHEQVPVSNSMAKIEGMDMMEYNGGTKDCDLPVEFMPPGLKRPMFASISS
mmetsp:Transcript_6339/g.11963  ORF Transcript_6339/g.11963 Transcript_6339/m.11963 type:complete len:413 (+) Transcript_6339:149-1387(+)